MLHDLKSDGHSQVMSPNRNRVKHPLDQGELDQLTFILNVDVRQDARRVMFVVKTFGNDEINTIASSISRKCCKEEDTDVRDQVASRSLTMMMLMM